MAYRLISSRFEPKRYVLYGSDHAVNCAIVTFLLVFYRPSVAAAVNYNVSSEGHATDRRTDSSPHWRVRIAGASKPPTMGGRSIPNI